MSTPDRSRWTAVVCRMIWGLTRLTDSDGMDFDAGQARSTIASICAITSYLYARHTQRQWDDEDDEDGTDRIHPDAPDGCPTNDARGE